MGSNPTRSAIATGEARLKRWWVQIGLAIAGVFGSYFGLTLTLFVLSMHRASLSQESFAWRPFPPLEPSQRLLIVAPHPDDEVLGCGGLIAEATQLGIPVRVVYLTAGDAFAGAATLLSRTTPDSNDYLQLGTTRIEEACKACQILGLNRSDLVFLGFPDRALWRLACAEGRTVRSETTQRDAVPYPEAMVSGVAYTAQNLVNALQQVLAEFQPTDVFAPHPLDDHPDHMAGALFTLEAIRQARTQGKLSHAPRLYYYLVHLGDWPLPQGWHPHRPLTPPVGLAYEDWHALSLSRSAVERKEEAIRAHATQYAMMTRFLSSFIRQSELFLPASSSPAYIRNPIDDNPTVHLRPSGDLLGIAITPKPTGLEVVVDTREPFAPPLQLRFTLITVDGRNRWRTHTWRYRSGQRRLLVQQEGTRLRFWLPKGDLQRQQSAYLLVQTRLYGVEVDRSGIVPVPIP